MAYTPATLTLPAWASPLTIQATDLLTGLDDAVNAIVSTNAGSIKNYINTEMAKVPTYLGAELVKVNTEALIETQAQVALATTQAGLATTNGAAQVALATTQVGLATTQAGLAAASYDSFDDRYLGAKTGDPTLDNDGAALLTGALVFNTTVNKMKVYTGSAWIIPDTGTCLQLTGGSLTGAINTAKTTVASAATTADIWGAGGNQIDWTGAVTCTGFPAAPQAGAERVLITAGASAFTAGANMLIDGVASGSTTTCAINDTVIVRAVSTTVFRLTRVKYDGTAVVAVSTDLLNQILNIN